MALKPVYLDETLGVIIILQGVEGRVDCEEACVVKRSEAVDSEDLGCSSN